MLSRCLHVREMQNGVVVGHTLPQPPQFEGLSMLVVQPFCGLEHAAQPSLQVGAHWLALQLVALAFVVLHDTLQPPQFAVSAEVGFSQPLFGSLSQSLKPVAQSGLHAPPAQDVVPWLFVHVVPQPPQFALSERWLDSQPFVGLPSQLWKLGLHCGAHTPPEQLLLLVLLSWQVVPQLPQFFLSVANTVAQPLFALPSQTPNCVPQLGAHLLATQLFEPCGALQAAPHAPQLFASEVGFDSQPFAICPSQSEKPVLHLSSTHALAEHLPVALSGAKTLLQLVPQVPQLPPSVLKFVAQPRPVPAQSENGGVHVLTTHLPASHFAVPLVMLHTLPHFPQLFGSFMRFTSQPS